MQANCFVFIRMMKCCIITCLHMRVNLGKWVSVPALDNDNFNSVTP